MSPSRRGGIQSHRANKKMTCSSTVGASRLTVGKGYWFESDQVNIIKWMISSVAERAPVKGRVESSNLSSSAKMVCSPSWLGHWSFEPGGWVRSSYRLPGALAEMVLLHPVEAGIIVVRFHGAPQTYGHDVMVACRVSKTDSLRSNRRARAKTTGYAYSCNEIVSDTFFVKQRIIHLLTI